MILKESFRMQNHLNALSSEALYFMTNYENMMSIKEEHLKSKSNPKAEDETVEVKKMTDMIPNMVIGLYTDVLKEKEKLSEAISRAKAKAEIDMDSALAINKAQQDAVSRLKSIAYLQASDTVTTGKDYLINSEGNQTPYYYNIRTVKTIDFDRDGLKGIIKRLQREADEVSTKIDLLNVTLEVDYEPKYDFDTSFEDAYEQYTSSQKASP
ncbi:MAG: hypothetical protein IKZ94_04605 [Lachnospiraceae bacterium]|nr:hypothetical protein [Lachnospiraceae bacterium]